MSEQIIDTVYGWREDDYDGYNDYYVNPEYNRSEATRKRIEQQDEEIEYDKPRTTTQDRRQYSPAASHSESAPR